MTPGSVFCAEVAAGAESFVLRIMNQPKLGIVGEKPGAVGGIVVDDENLGIIWGARNLVRRF